MKRDCDWLGLMLCCFCTSCRQWCRTHSKPSSIAPHFLLWVTQTSAAPSIKRKEVRFLASVLFLFFHDFQSSRELPLAKIVKLALFWSGTQVVFCISFCTLLVVCFWVAPGSFLKRCNGCVERQRHLFDVINRATFYLQILVSSGSSPCLSTEWCSAKT